MSLPILLNSTSRRVKTLETYIAPRNLRGTVYHCVEFPDGVFINEYGEVCPDHELTGSCPAKHTEGTDLEDDEGDSVLDETEYESEEEEEEEDVEDEGDEEFVLEEEEEEEEEDEPSDQGEPASEDDLNVESVQEFFSKCQESEHRARHRRKMLDLAQQLLDDWESIKESMKNFKFSYSSDLIVNEPRFSFKIHAVDGTRTASGYMLTDEVTFNCSTCDDFRFNSLHVFVRHNCAQKNNV